MKTTISRQLSLIRFGGALLCALLLMVHAASAQTTKFTYEWRVANGTSLPDGNYVMQFKLFDALENGHQVGPTLTFDGVGENPLVTVTNGAFIVQLDFEAAPFTGANRYLDAAVMYPSQLDFVPLPPRQQLTSTPYAIRSLSAAVAETAINADNATNAKNLDGVAASQYVLTGDSRLSNARPPTPGSSDYIQNTTSQQSPANFNISGNGTVAGTLSGNTVSATTQYNLGSQRMLSAPGINNLFVGAGAGQNNTTGSLNSFFGATAGQANTQGSSNSFFGQGTGNHTTIGPANSFFGDRAGMTNETGGDNSFFGAFAGYRNLSGDANSFVGRYAGMNNVTGGGNSFFGKSSGFGNTTGTYITLIGSSANVANDGLDHATAVGADASVSSSNTVVLGRSADTVRVPGNFVGNGTIIVSTLGAAGSTTLCRNSLNEISNCSSSLRYKTNIARFSSGLNLVRRLRPISFDWTMGGMHDVGFGAEEVAALNPLFVTYNSNGQVEGVKYDRLSVAFVNAFKEQQAQIEQQRDRIRKQQDQIDGLRKLVCRNHRNAGMCK